MGSPVLAEKEVAVATGVSPNGRPTRARKPQRELRSILPPPRRKPTLGELTASDWAWSENAGAFLTDLLSRGEGDALGFGSQAEAFLQVGKAKARTQHQERQELPDGQEGQNLLDESLARLCGWIAFWEEAAEQARAEGTAPGGGEPSKPWPAVAATWAEGA